MTPSERIEAMRSIIIQAVIEDQSLDKSDVMVYPREEQRIYTKYAEKAAALLSSEVEKARLEGMESAKARVLRRTEIPSDARNPTRDWVVILGEEIAGFIDQDIAELHHNKGENNE